MNANTKVAQNIVTNIKNSFSNAANSTVDAIKNLTPNTGSSSFQSSAFFWIIVFAIAGIVVGALYSVNKANTSVATPTNVNATKEDQRALFESKLTTEFKDKKSLSQAIQEQQVSERENCLINFQPLTVIHPGFLGPLQDGVYDETLGVTTAIRMGARCFILPIDYHNASNMPDSFPPPNKPCLVYRDEGGNIRSINGGNIATVARTISEVAWSDIVSQRNDPFILVLYFVRTPPEGTREYLNFLSEVAMKLQPLSPYLLGQTPEGVYNRQARQDKLMFMSTNQLEKKLLIFCNVDTSGFRTSKADFKVTYPPKFDLDYWVHMRIFKQNAETILGMTSLPGQNVVPRGAIEKTSYYVTLPTDTQTQKKAVDGTKEKFMIAVSPQGKNPELTTATLLLDTYGVQALPLLIVDYSAETQSLLNKWKYAWRAKPKNIRYVRPEAIQVQAQSTKANANGGALTIPR